MTKKEDKMIKVGDKVRVLPSAGFDIGEEFVVTEVERAGIYGAPVYGDRTKSGAGNEGYFDEHLEVVK